MKKKRAAKINTKLENPEILHGKKIKVIRYLIRQYYKVKVSNYKYTTKQWFNFIIKFKIDKKDLIEGMKYETMMYKETMIRLKTVYNQMYLGNEHRIAPMTENQRYKFGLFKQLYADLLRIVKRYPRYDGSVIELILSLKRDHLHSKIGKTSLKLDVKKPGIFNFLYVPLSYIKHTFSFINFSAYLSADVKTKIRYLKEKITYLNSKNINNFKIKETYKFFWFNKNFQRKGKFVWWKHAYFTNQLSKNKRLSWWYNAASYLQWDCVESYLWKHIKHINEISKLLFSYKYRKVKYKTGEKVEMKAYLYEDTIQNFILNKLNVLNWDYNLLYFWKDIFFKDVKNVCKRVYINAEIIKRNDRVIHLWKYKKKLRQWHLMEKNKTGRLFYWIQSTQGNKMEKNKTLLMNKLESTIIGFVKSYRQKPHFFIVLNYKKMQVNNYVKFGMMSKLYRLDLNLLFATIKKYKNIQQIKTWNRNNNVNKFCVENERKNTNFEYWLINLIYNLNNQFKTILNIILINLQSWLNFNDFVKQNHWNLINSLNNLFKKLSVSDLILPKNAYNWYFYNHLGYHWISFYIWNFMTGQIICLRFDEFYKKRVLVKQAYKRLMPNKITNPVKIKDSESLLKSESMLDFIDKKRTPYIFFKKNILKHFDYVIKLYRLKSKYDLNFMNNNELLRSHNVWKKLKKNTNNPWLNEKSYYLKYKFDNRIYNLFRSGITDSSWKKIRLMFLSDSSSALYKKVIKKFIQQGDTKLSIKTNRFVGLKKIIFTKFIGQKKKKDYQNKLMESRVFNYYKKYTLLNIKLSHALQYYEYAAYFKIYKQFIKTKVLDPLCYVYVLYNNNTIQNTKKIVKRKKSAESYNVIKGNRLLKKEHLITMNNSDNTYSKQRSWFFNKYQLPFEIFVGKNNIYIDILDQIVRTWKNLQEKLELLFHILYIKKEVYSGNYMLHKHKFVSNFRAKKRKHHTSEAEDGYISLKKKMYEKEKYIQQLQEFMIKKRGVLKRFNNNFKTHLLSKIENGNWFVNLDMTEIALGRAIRLFNNSNTFRKLYFKNKHKHIGVSIFLRIKMRNLKNLNGLNLKRKYLEIWTDSIRKIYTYGLHRWFNTMYIYTMLIKTKQERKNKNLLLQRREIKRRGFIYRNKTETIKKYKVILKEYLESRWFSLPIIYQKEKMASNDGVIHYADSEYESVLYTMTVTQLIQTIKDNIFAIYYGKPIKLFQGKQILLRKLKIENEKSNETVLSKIITSVINKIKVLWENKLNLQLYKLAALPAFKKQKKNKNSAKKVRANKKEIEDSVNLINEWIIRSPKWKRDLTFVFRESKKSVEDIKKLYKINDSFNFMDNIVMERILYWIIRIFKNGNRNIKDLQGGHALTHIILEDICKIITSAIENAKNIVMNKRVEQAYMDVQIEQREAEVKLLLEQLNKAIEYLYIGDNYKYDVQTLNKFIEITNKKISGFFTEITKIENLQSTLFTCSHPPKDSKISKSKYINNVFEENVCYDAINVAFKEINKIFKNFITNVNSQDYWVRLYKLKHEDLFVSLYELFFSLKKSIIKYPNDLFEPYINMKANHVEIFNNYINDLYTLHDVKNQSSLTLFLLLTVCVVWFFGTCISKCFDSIIEQSNLGTVENMHNMDLEFLSTSFQGYYSTDGHILNLASWEWVKFVYWHGICVLTLICIFKLFLLWLNAWIEYDEKFKMNHPDPQLDHKIEVESYFTILDKMEVEKFLVDLRGTLFDSMLLNIKNMKVHQQKDYLIHVLDQLCMNAKNPEELTALLDKNINITSDVEKLKNLNVNMNKFDEVVSTGLKIAKNDSNDDVFYIANLDRFWINDNFLVDISKKSIRSKMDFMWDWGHFYHYISTNSEAWNAYDDKILVFGNYVIEGFFNQPYIIYFAFYCYFFILIFISAKILSLFYIIGKKIMSILLYQLLYRNTLLNEMGLQYRNYELRFLKNKYKISKETYTLLKANRFNPKLSSTQNGLYNWSKEELDLQYLRDNQDLQYYYSKLNNKKYNSLHEGFFGTGLHLRTAGECYIFIKDLLEKEIKDIENKTQLEVDEVLNLGRKGKSSAFKVKKEINMFKEDINSSHRYKKELWETYNNLLCLNKLQTKNGINKLIYDLIFYDKLKFVEWEIKHKWRSTVLSNEGTESVKNEEKEVQLNEKFIKSTNSTESTKQNTQEQKIKSYVIDKIALLDFYKMQENKTKIFENKAQEYSRYQRKKLVESEYTYSWKYNLTSFNWNSLKSEVRNELSEKKKLLKKIEDEISNMEVWVDDSNYWAWFEKDKRLETEQIALPKIMGFFTDLHNKSELNLNDVSDLIKKTRKTINSKGQNNDSNTQEFNIFMFEPLMTVLGEANLVNFARGRWTDTQNVFAEVELLKMTPILYYTLYQKRKQKHLKQNELILDIMGHLYYVDNQTNLSGYFIGLENHIDFLNKNKNDMSYWSIFKKILGKGITKKSNNDALNINKIKKLYFYWLIENKKQLIREQLMYAKKDKSDWIFRMMYSKHMLLFLI